MIHDLHFRPVVRDLNRLLNDEQVKQILSGSIGFEGHQGNFSRGCTVWPMPTGPGG